MPNRIKVASMIEALSEEKFQEFREIVDPQIEEREDFVHYIRSGSDAVDFGDVCEALGIEPPEERSAAATEEAARAAMRSAVAAESSAKSARWALGMSALALIVSAVAILMSAIK